MRLYRPQVGEQAELPTQRQQPGLGARFRGRVVPLGATHCAEDDRIRRSARRQSGLGERIAVFVDGDTAHELLLEGEVVVEVSCDRSENLAGFGRDLWAYSVAG